jgi:hypothetical protein
MNREFIEPKAYFEKPYMGWLSFAFIIASFVMAWFCLQELADRGEPYQYFSHIDSWDMMCFAWTNTIYFKYWIGCVVLSIICHPLCGGMFHLVVSPLLLLATLFFRMITIEPLFAGKWELFGGNVIILISLVLLVFALPIILVGVSADVSAEMEKERQAEETKSQYPFNEDFARAMDGVMKS